MQISTNEIGISKEQLAAFFGALENVNALNLWSVSLMIAGHGHYDITSIWHVNGQRIELKKTTSNMALIDAWKSGVNLYEDGDDGYGNWNQVVESMLRTIDAEDSIYDVVGVQ